MTENIDLKKKKTGVIHNLSTSSRIHRCCILTAHYEFHTIRQGMGIFSKQNWISFSEKKKWKRIVEDINYVNAILINFESVFCLINILDISPVFFKLI
jgi:hypothetical protein